MNLKDYMMLLKGFMVHTPYGNCRGLSCKSWLVCDHEYQILMPCDAGGLCDWVLLEPATAKAAAGNFLIYGPCIIGQDFRNALSSTLS